MRCEVLRRLLELVAEGGVHRYAHLARQLGVSGHLLDQMLHYLARTGYVRPLAHGSAAQCDGCPLTRACSIGGPTRVWTLTEKGQLGKPGRDVRSRPCGDESLEKRSQ